MIIKINLDRELPLGEEAYGFMCESDGFFITEDNFEELAEVDTAEDACPNCGEIGVLIPAKVVQRDS